MTNLSDAVHFGRLPALMRPLFPLLVIPLLAGVPAHAQVTVNLNALEALPPRGASERPARHTVRQVHAPQHLATAAQPTLPIPPVPPATQVARSAPTAPPTPAPAHSPPAATVPAAPQAKVALAPTTPPPAPAPARPPPAATIPAAPPPEVALAPLAPATPSAAPPVAPPVAANAASAPAPTASGLTITFGSDQSDLSAATDEAIQKLARAAPNSDTTSFNVLAYAHGDPQDPSTARRLSLSRALAIRSALMAAGVPSTRVYVRALGDQGGKGPPDRADITVMGLNAPAATAAATPGTPAGGKPE
jgi:outer membrane protein OmpA-like peptidoglycan-associated protein